MTKTAWTFMILMTFTSIWALLAATGSRTELLIINERIDGLFDYVHIYNNPKFIEKMSVLIKMQESNVVPKEMFTDQGQIAYQQWINNYEGK